MYEKTGVRGCENNKYGIINIKYGNFGGQKLEIC